jgi:hypothetical protein
LLFGGFARHKNEISGGSFMKNKILFFGSLCLILALGLVFVRCAQTVEFAKPASPKSFEADLSSQTLTVKWKAVEGLVNYGIVFQQPGKVSYGSLYDRDMKYENTDMDSWSCTATLNANNTGLASGQKVKIGVITRVCSHYGKGYKYKPAK